MDAIQPRTADELTSLNRPTLEQLERQTTAFLYAIWKAQGKEKRVVDVRKARNDSDLSPFDRR